MSKSPEAFRTISEVSEWLDTPTYVLRFWESRFSQIKPVKRAGGRRYYRPEDMMLLGGIKKLLHFDELTIKAVKQILKDKGVKHVMELSPDLGTPVVSPQSKADEEEKAEIARMVEAGPLPEPPAEKTAEAADEAPEKKPAVEVRVIKKGKLSQPEEPDTDAPAPAAEEAALEEAAEETPKQEAAGVKEPEAEDLDSDATDAPQPSEAEEFATVEAAAAAEADTPEAPEEPAPEPEPEPTADEPDWDNLPAAMIRRGPATVRPFTAYDADTLSEIETLYYSLRMARNGMVRAKAEQENRTG